MIHKLSTEIISVGVIYPCIPSCYELCGSPLRLSCSIWCLLSSSPLYLPSESKFLLYRWILPQVDMGDKKFKQKEKICNSLQAMVVVLQKNFLNVNVYIWESWTCEAKWNALQKWSPHWKDNMPKAKYVLLCLHVSKKNIFPQLNSALLSGCSYNLEMVCSFCKFLNCLVCHFLLLSLRKTYLRNRQPWQRRD